MERGDEGFGRNVRKVFGAFGDDYDGMGGRPLQSVTLSDDKALLTFTFQDGGEAKFKVEGDCCSYSWIEHISVPDDVAGAVLTAVEDERISQSETGELQVYQTKFRTPKGDIILEYRNESNGYYGGYLVRVRE